MTNRHWYDDSVVVRGCQGRFFLPVTILFFFFLRITPVAVQGRDFCGKSATAVHS